MAAWAARDAVYWEERSHHLIERIRREWTQDSSAAQWPDAFSLLDLLTAPPEQMIRQLPAAARDAMALCDNESIARVELASRLSRDPSLVQGLLRQANGAFYGAGLSPILRVDAAIDRIGIAGTRAVVLAACVDGLLSKPGGAYDTMLAAAWAHMIDSGPVARTVAPNFGADPEEAFAVALLHDVGKLVIFDRISSLRLTNRKPVLIPDGWLMVLLDQLHEPLGALAAHRWGLGARAADAIGSHHRRERPALVHPLAESLFLASKVLKLEQDGGALDYDAIWSLGQLSGDPRASQDALDRKARAA